MKVNEPQHVIVCSLRFTTQNAWNTLIVKLKTLKNENQLRVSPSSSVHNSCTLAYYRVGSSNGGDILCTATPTAYGELPATKPNQIHWKFIEIVFRDARTKISPIICPAKETHTHTHTYIQVQESDFINRFMYSVSETRRTA